ncbi:MAG: tetratricopeptide (TPR) repeat protein [Psychromonas sp.]|jgi:tetratricopeptide (TPR) repeat protein
MKNDVYSTYPQAAASSLERAIRIAPRFPESYYRLGELRYQEGVYNQAVLLAQKALRLGAAGMLRRQAQDLVSKSGAY